MKKFTAILAMFFLFSVSAPISVSAYSGGNKYKKSFNGKHYKKQKQRKRARQRNRRRAVRNNCRTRNYNRRSRNYDQRNYRRRDQRSVYSRHRNAFNIGIGGAAGAIVGGIIGGKKGALIGAGVGAGSGAAYTYGINPKKKRRRTARRYRR